MAQDGTWSTKASAPTPRLYSGHAPTIGGKIYIAGGITDSTWSSRLDVCDAATDSWTTAAPMPSARAGHGAAALNGMIYVVGGQFDLATLGVVEAYDPVTNTWSTRAPMPTPRNRLSVAVVNGILYAMGGCLDNACAAFVATVEAYDPVTNTWSPRASMPTPRRDFTAVAMDGRIYTAGGAFGPGCSVSAAFEVYDPATNTWQVKADLPTPRTGAALGALNGYVYAVTGHNCIIGNFNMQTAEAYDPSTNSWVSVAPVPTGRPHAAVGVAGGVLYAIANDSTGVVNEAFTPTPVALTVGIDIVPGTSKNWIFLSLPLVPVAILSSATFDATQVDPSTVRLEGAAVAVLRWNNQFACFALDVNHDARRDLLCFVKTAELGVAPGDSSATLTAKTFAGQSIQGSDSIRVLR